MPHSWQDVDNRVRTLESKLDFLMRSVSVQQVGQTVGLDGRPAVRQMNLLEVWREVTNAGGLVDEPAQPTVSSPVEAING